jgi:hypothetical protein
VPEITIETSGGATEFKDGAQVTLKATAPPGTFGYQWKLNQAPIPDATTAEHSFAMGTATAGEYVVEAKLAGDDLTSNAITLTRATGDDAPAFHRLFATAAALVLVFVGVLLVIGLQYLASRILFGAFWTGLEGRLKVALVLGLPSMIVGTVVVMIGAWMAIVEWRGKLRKPAARGFQARTIGAGDVKEIVSAVGNLRGAGLVLVVGAILMLGSAWVAQSAAGTAGPNAGAGTAAPQETTSTPVPVATPRVTVAPTTPPTTRPTPS